jgi:hypothetical protein
MTADVVISVRGEATTRVEPDQATLFGGIRIVGREKSAVLAEAAGALQAVEADLASLDGVVATPSTARVPLAWLASSASSYDELRWDERAQDEQPTGRVFGTVDVEIRVRDFALLERVADRLAAHPTMHVHNTGWSVDDDNPAWPRVRADAIRAALHRARDYAAALGGSVSGVEQIADAGLLAGADNSAVMFSGARAAAASRESASPRLTPQPQVLQAAIDARVVASVPDLSL